MSDHGKLVCDKKNDPSRPKNLVRKGGGGGRARRMGMIRGGECKERKGEGVGYRVFQQD